jgi:hypothetical protein
MPCAYVLQRSEDVGHYGSSLSCPTGDLDAAAACNGSHPTNQPTKRTLAKSTAACRKDSQQGHGSVRQKSCPTRMACLTFRFRGRLPVQPSVDNVGIRRYADKGQLGADIITHQRPSQANLKKESVFKHDGEVMTGYHFSRRTRRMLRLYFVRSFYSVVPSVAAAKSPQEARPPSKIRRGFVIHAA